MAGNNNNDISQHPELISAVFDKSFDEFDSQQTSVKEIITHECVNDQTYLKQINLTPLGPPSQLLSKGENLSSNVDYYNQSYLDASFSHTNGYSQCGQNIPDESFLYTQFAYLK